MRDFHRPAPCPACETRNVTVLHSTFSGSYLACGSCGHTWHAERGSIDPLRQPTSAAFRMTTRVVQGKTVLVSAA